MIRLKKMSHEEFSNFKDESQLTYATDLAQAMNLTLAEARSSAREQFDNLVSDGLSTPGQFFYLVILNSTEEVIGFLWLGVQKRNGKEVTSINDIQIKSNFRGRGFGKALMGLVELEAKSFGTTCIRLHVFARNEVAKALYFEMGYEPVSLYLQKNV